MAFLPLSLCFSPVVDSSPGVWALGTYVTCVSESVLKEKPESVQHRNLPCSNLQPVLVIMGSLLYANYNNEPTTEPEGNRISFLRLSGKAFNAQRTRIREDVLFNLTDEKVFLQLWKLP